MFAILDFDFESDFDCDYSGIDDIYLDLMMIIFDLCKKSFEYPQAISRMAQEICSSMSKCEFFSRGWTDEYEFENEYEYC